MTKFLTTAALLIALVAPAVAGDDAQVACANEMIKIERQAKKLKITRSLDAASASHEDDFGVCGDPDYGKRVISLLKQCIKTRQTNCK